MRIASNKRGGMLLELAIAIVLLSFIAIPIVDYVAGMAEVRKAGQDSARRKAWVALHEQSFAEGVDPNSAPLFAGEGEVQDTRKRAGLPASSRPDASAIVMTGRTQVLPMLSEFSGARWNAVGWEIGAGSEAPPLDPLPSALPPTFLAEPTMSPASGTFVSVFTLSSGGPGSPSTISVSATGTPGAIVQLRLNAPTISSATGTGVASIDVTGANLSQQARGEAWAEFDPSTDPTAVAVAIGDGRTRWLVQEGALWRTYEPSEKVNFTLGLDLGTPSLFLGATEYSTLSSIGIDILDVESIQAGTTDIRIGLSSGAFAALGSDGPDIESSLGFNWTFNGSGGPFSGDASTFLSAASLPSFLASNAIVARYEGGIGLSSGIANFALTRETIALDPPELLTDADLDFGGTSTFAPGAGVELGVPEIDGTRRGRIAIDGTRFSTGPTITETLP